MSFACSDILARRVDINACEFKACCFSHLNWQGPCRREIDSILSGLKITDILNPRGFRIPNCDKKGFYKKKQVNMPYSQDQHVLQYRIRFDFLWRVAETRLCF